MDSNSEEARQRRREKIMARLDKDGEEGEEGSSSSPDKSVYDRYRSMKDRIEQQRKLLQLSKGVGLVIVVLAMFLPVTAVYSAVTSILIFLAIRISRNTNSDPKQTEKNFSWLGKWSVLVSKLQYLQQIWLISRVVLNVLLSYLLASVLVNVASLAIFNLQGGVSESL